MNVNNALGVFGYFLIVRNDNYGRAFLVGLDPQRIQLAFGKIYLCSGHSFSVYTMVYRVKHQSG